MVKSLSKYRCLVVMMVIGDLTQIACSYSRVVNKKKRRKVKGHGQAFMLVLSLSADSQLDLTSQHGEMRLRHLESN